VKSTEASRPASTARIAVWDLPTRLFHWILAALIGFSWWTAEEEELELHIYSGYAVLTLLLFRLLWGLFGSSTARFRNFVKGPAAVLAYARNIRGWRALVCLVAALGITRWIVAGAPPIG
jgi:cytochrome b